MYLVAKLTMFSYVRPGMPSGLPGRRSLWREHRRHDCWPMALWRTTAFPLAYRPAALIFIGLAVVSLGTRQRREGGIDDKDDLGHAKTDAEQVGMGRRSTLISELRADRRRRRSSDGKGGGGSR